MDTSQNPPSSSSSASASASASSSSSSSSSPSSSSPSFSSSSSFSASISTPASTSATVTNRPESEGKDGTPLNKAVRVVQEHFHHSHGHIHDREHCHANHSEEKRQEDAPTNAYDSDLEDIDLANEQLPDIDDFSHCKQLKSLTLRHNLIRSDSLKKLGTIPLLETLDLYGNRLTPLEENTFSVEHFPSLTDLDVSFNEIRYIRGFEGAKNLENLYLIANKITTIENLGALSNLRLLELGSNRIRNIQNIDNLKQLRELYLGKNKIDNVENLDALENLEILSLQNNRLVNINVNAFGNLKKLHELYLSHNAIEKIEGFEHLNSLKLLDLTANRIKVIENVNHLKCLEDFWLGYNLLESFDSLSEFTDDIKLNAIYLEHNPVVLAVTAQVYCDTVKKYCPHINQIDADILGDINLDQR